MLNDTRIRNATKKAKPYKLTPQRSRNLTHLCSPKLTHQVRRS